MPKRRVPLSEIIIARGWAKDKRSAQAVALSGRIRSSGGKVFDKPGMLLDPGEDLHFSSGRRFVSRGGDKLQCALESFGIKPEGFVCIDFGSSTGGFADCLLQNGAIKVYCVDVAYGKLDWKLRSDPRAVNMEKTNFSALSKNNFKEPIDLAVMDISFSSCKKCLAKAAELIRNEGFILLLFKPQFEVDSRYLQKGILKNGAIRDECINNFLVYLETEGMKCLKHADSEVKGRKGNSEYFFYIKKGGSYGNEIP